MRETRGEKRDVRTIACPDALVRESKPALKIGSQESRHLYSSEISNFSEAYQTRPVADPEINIDAKAKPKRVNVIPFM